MAKEHSTITDPNIHESKGVASATLSHVYSADGAGSGVWTLPTPCANFHFTNLAAASTMSLTTAYQKLNDANMSSNMASDGVSNEMTYADGTATYTGSKSRQFSIMLNVSIDHAAGAARDVQFAIYKNGVIVDHAEMIMTTASGDKASGALAANILMNTNDFIEVYSKASVAITLNIYNVYVFAMGFMNA